MKLTEMNYKKMKRLLATIAAEAAPLLDDEEIMELFGSFSKEAREENREYGRRVGQKLLRAIVLMSDKHETVFDRIFCAIFNCTEEELEEKSMKEILTQLKDIFDDEVLRSFLPQFGALDTRDL
ncbi:MAG: hypothetical protein FWE24_09210 [Defluviitaleaceae bacterium]|nr:hypothetical protein [Defluviitaleaceae bacterium]